MVQSEQLVQELEKHLAKAEPRRAAYRCAGGEGAIEHLAAALHLVVISGDSKRRS